MCGEPLWTTRMTRTGPRCVPQRLYNTQDFESWLEYFLMRPDTEDLIDQSYEHHPTPGVMLSIWDSPAWHSLGPFTTTRGNLTFTFYIDWFNPYTNKISGKTVSCGAMIMTCLNLPYELQRLPKNTFFVGIIPPPYEPSVTTITAVSDPVVAQLKTLWKGKNIRTYHHPNGSFKRVAVLVQIGDLLAVRKAFGFAGIASHNICSFCTIQKSEIGGLQCGERRMGATVLSDALKWRDATTKKQRKELFLKTGVRWSSFNELEYRDPVLHTMLGVMHNWLEGILQHHARVKWGIGIIPMAHKANNLENDLSTTNFPDSDGMLDEEIEELFEETQRHGDFPTHLTRMHSTMSMLADPEFGYGEESSDESFHLVPDDGDVSNKSSSSDYDSEADFQAKESDEWKSVCIFDSASLTNIRTCLADTVIPSWLERPPTNLGERSHGKLKADQWLQLFIVFLPLILPEIWSSGSATNNSLLHNFHDLVVCTNIICAYSVTTESADLYHDHYIRYLESSRTLFPKTKMRPNHHFALHNTELMKFWGPLIKLSEFPFEQDNGILQKINTNSHLCVFNFFCLNLENPLILNLKGNLISPCSVRSVGVDGWMPFCMIMH